MVTVERESGIPRAVPWIVAVGVLGLGAFALLGPQRPDPQGSPLPVESLARLPRPEVPAVRTELHSWTETSPVRVAGEQPDPGDGEWPQDVSPSRSRAFETAFGPMDESSSVPLSGRADEELHGDGPDERRVAYLRAVHRHDRERSDAVFVRAIRELPMRSSAHGTSVPEYALAHLGARADSEPGARSALRVVTFGPERVASASLRTQAAIHLGRTSSASELQALAAELRAEPDELVRAAFAAGLSSNPEERLVRLLFTDLLAERAALAGDGDPHQDLETR